MESGGPGRGIGVRGGIQLDFELKGGVITEKVIEEMEIDARKGFRKRSSNGVSWNLAQQLRD